MARERGVELRVGLTVVIATLVLVIGTAWLAGSGLHRKGYTVTVIFPQVGGLAADDPVMVSGVEKGRVTAVDLRPHDVAVTVWLPGDVKVPDDSRWSLEAIGMMGERFVGVRPGASETMIAEGAELRGDYRPAASEVASSAGEMVDTVARLVSRIDSLLAGAGEGALAQTSEAAREARELLAENRADLRATLQAMREASQDARGLVSANREPLTEAIENLARASRRMDDAVERLDAASGPLVRAAERVGRGEGSLGKFVADDSLYFELRRTVRGLDSLLTEVREDPSRFFKVEIF